MRTHPKPLPLRLGASLTALCFAWSLALAPSACLAVSRAPLAPGHIRALSPDEMRAIVGAGGGGGPAAPASADPDGPGAPMPWVPAVNGTDTGNGNKLTSLPLVGWTARGGLPVAFALSHSSQSARSAELGQKWSHSYDITWPSAGRHRAGASAEPATVTWGDGQSYAFTGGGGLGGPGRRRSTTR